jgi:signal transduction histidine kinase
LLQKTREIAIVEERTRLARDMHDGIAQNLAYLLIQVDRGLNMVDEGSKLEAQLEQISALLKQNIDELRRNIFDLRPVDLEGKSILEVLENFVEEFGRRWSLQTSWRAQGDEIEITPEVESTLYRILQEALSNAQQHAQCTRLSVQLDVVDGGWVSLEIIDNGLGFDVDQISRGQSRPRGRGLGLVSMGERAESVGGEFTVESVPGQGTRIYTRLPLGLTGPKLEWGDGET